jgi:hypothetical protein
MMSTSPDSTCAVASSRASGETTWRSIAFFSRARFPFGEDSRVCERNLLHLVENRFEGSAIADDPLESAFGLVPRGVRNWFIICHKTSSFQAPHAIAINLFAHISIAARTVLSNN